MNHIPLAYGIRYLDKIFFGIRGYCHGQTHHKTLNELRANVTLCRLNLIWIHVRIHHRIRFGVRALISLLSNPAALVSFRTIVRHIFGRHILRLPWGFQSNTYFAISLAKLLWVWPIQFHFRRFVAVLVFGTRIHKIKKCIIHTPDWTSPF